MGRLEGMAAIVTGAARGIGRAVAEAFAAEGADLALVTLKSPLDSLAESLRARGARVEIFTGDVADAAFAKKTVDGAAESFGKVDILVNNAGITRDGLLMRMSEEDFDEVIRVNLKGAFNMTKAAAARMVRARRGRIINVSSVVGQVGNAGQANYASSKAGLLGMTKSAARELAPRGITVNAVAPGFIETDMTASLPEKVREETLKAIPLGRFGKAPDVAAAAVFLASEEAGYITGATISVNGGMAMI
ncbi:MAG: 3-oxoacyl-[acyl-carrier-protein] reductase [Candidatus Nitrospinota bacterium M3_3B_026]